MIALNLLLLGLVGFCACDDFLSGILSTYQPRSVKLTPEKQIQYVKDYLKFFDEYFAKQWWLAENLTCNEADNMLETMNDNIQSDLDLLMADFKEYLKPDIIVQNMTKDQCKRNLREDIETSIKEGTDYFRRCTERSKSVVELDREDLKNNYTKYLESVNFTISNIDKCLEHSSKFSEDLRKKCINDRLTEYLNNLKPAVDAYYQSECMNYFKNSILKCTYTVFDSMITKKNYLKQKYMTCFGWTFNNDREDIFINKNESLIQDIQLVILHYNGQFRKNIDQLYHFLLIESFGFLYRLSQEEYTAPDFSDTLQPYFNTINKTFDENISPLERNCSNEAYLKLTNHINEATSDFEECYNFTAQYRKAGIIKLPDAIKEFSEKLPEAGNVALLRCFGQRPQDIFYSPAIKKCAELAWDNISLEFDLVKIQINNVTKAANQTFSQVLPGGMICGSMRERKLIMDAKQVLFDCSRCLYGLDGQYYAVTPAGVSTDTTPGSLTTGSTETTTTEHSLTTGHYHYSEDYEYSEYNSY